MNPNRPLKPMIQIIKKGFLPHNQLTHAQDANNHVKCDNTNRGVPHSWFKSTRTYSILLTVNACRATLSCLFSFNYSLPYAKLGHTDPGQQRGDLLFVFVIESGFHPFEKCFLHIRDAFRLLNENDRRRFSTYSNIGQSSSHFPIKLRLHDFLVLKLPGLG